MTRTTIRMRHTMCPTKAHFAAPSEIVAEDSISKDIAE